MNVRPTTCNHGRMTRAGVPIDVLCAARALVQERFASCHTAILAGSVVRGDATATSDLDLFVLTDDPGAPYRESFVYEGWPVEAFVHTESSAKRFFASDVGRRRPSLPMMCSEGVIIKDDRGLAEGLKKLADQLLASDPPPLTPDELEDKRYRLTDILDDFRGADAAEPECWFIAGDLAAAAADLMMSVRGKWTGTGKWLIRALRAYDQAMAEALSAAVAAFSRHKDKAGLISFAERALAEAGGRLFEGYRRPR